MNAIFEKMIETAEADSKKYEKNMEFWKTVSITDPRFTKRVRTRGGFTAIDAHSQIMTATAQWGSFGGNWGVKDENFSMLAEGLLLYTAIFFYPSGTKTVETGIHSSISILFTDKDGNTHLDDDCVKKVATDALTKGLSKLGFNADVFLGLYDDNRYVSEVTHAFATKRFVFAIREIQRRVPQEGFEDALKAHDVNDLRNVPVESRESFYKDLLTYEASLNTSQTKLKAV
jgi:hypothetical protein